MWTWFKFSSVYKKKLLYLLVYVMVWCVFIKIIFCTCLAGTENGATQIANLTHGRYNDFKNKFCITPSGDFKAKEIASPLTEYFFWPPNLPSSRISSTPTFYFSMLHRSLNNIINRQTNLSLRQTSGCNIWQLTI